MKNFLFLVLMVLASFAVAQTDMSKFPTYEAVVNRFYADYSVKEVPNTSFVTFEKRPQGWFVVVTDFAEGPKVIKNELLWNSTDQSFRKIDFVKAESKNENLEKISESMRKFDRPYYDMSPYYGYPGWDWDVIRTLKDATALGDTLLYVLGRAYSSYSSNLLNDNSGLADKTKQFKLPKGKNCLTEAQLKEYRLYRHLAIDKFRQLAKQNPRFMTIIGPIWIKASNEYLCSFLDLRIYQNEQEAHKELIDGLYNDLYIGYAKNYLNSCAKNAILFTNGDNDTYPLLYVQAKYGFRTDVLVVNLSLLQTERYINSLRDKTLNAPALPLSLSPEDISANKKDVVYIVESEKISKPIELSNMVKMVKEEKFTIPNVGSNYVYVPSGKFMFTKGKQTLNWELKNKYLFLNQLILSDVIATGKLDRPVYFGSAIDHDSYFGLSDYFRLEGLAYRLTMSNYTKPDQTGYIHSRLLYDNLMNKFDWSGIKSIDNTEKMTCVQYRTVFHRLAEALIEEEKVDSARKVLDFCVDLMPNDRCRFDGYFVPVIEDYYRIHEFEKGSRIAKVLIQNLKNDTDADLYDDPKGQSEWNKYLLEFLKDLFAKYNQDAMLKELEK